MTEEVRSLNPDRDIEPAEIVDMLGGQSLGAAVLALCSAERLSAIADTLAKSPAARTAVRTGLDLGWSVVVVKPGLRADAVDSTLARAISRLTELADSSESDVPAFQSELNHVLLATVCALLAVRDGSANEAVNAVEHCRDMYFQLAARTWPRLGLDDWLNSPVVRDEVRREIREARVISDWRGEVTPSKVEPLRRAARADSEILVKLIRGEPVAEGEDANVASQDPLF
jgi:hypothetical protein